jgi:hypothetical protein
MIASRLAVDARAGAGQRATSALRDPLAAFHAVGCSFADRKTCARGKHAIDDCVLNLFEDRALMGPTSGHLSSETPFE